MGAGARTAHGSGPERARVRSHTWGNALILTAPAQALPSRQSRPARDGFTYVELLVSLAIIAVLTALVVPLVGRGRAAAQSVACLANLRQIGGAFLQYAGDNDKRLPDPFELQTSWEQILHKYTGDADVFRCAGDGELFPAIGSSYDWRDTGRAETTLAGRLITDSSRSNCVLVFEALPGWHTKGKMNAVLLDGAGLTMDQNECMADLYQPIRPALTPRRGEGKVGAP